jgi:hypothetical protein
LGRQVPDDVREILDNITAAIIIKKYKILEREYGRDWFIVLSIDRLFGVASFSKLRPDTLPQSVGSQQSITFYERITSSTVSTNPETAGTLSSSSGESMDEIIINPSKKEINKIISKNTKTVKKTDTDEFVGLSEIVEQSEQKAEDNKIVRFIYDYIFMDDLITDVRRKIYLYSNIFPEYQYMFYLVDEVVVPVSYRWLRTSGKSIATDVNKILAFNKIKKVIDDDFYTKARNGEYILENNSDSILADIPRIQHYIYVHDFKAIIRNFTMRDITEYIENEIDAQRLY